MDVAACTREVIGMLESLADAPGHDAVLRPSPQHTAPLPPCQSSSPLSSAAVAVAARHRPLGRCWRRRCRKAFEAETSSSLPSWSVVIVVVVPPSPLSLLPLLSPSVVVIVVIGSHGSHIQWGAWSSPSRLSWLDVVIPGDVRHLQVVASSSVVLPLPCSSLLVRCCCCCRLTQAIGPLLASPASKSLRDRDIVVPALAVVAVVGCRRRRGAVNEMARSLGADGSAWSSPVFVGQDEHGRASS